MRASRDPIIARRTRLAALLLAISSLLMAVVPVLAATGSDDASGPGGITLNFKDADIREVAATIGQITHKNFIIDPRVQGRVTVVSAKPVSADAVYATFLSVLEVHGLAAAPAGQVIKIVPSLEARQMPGPEYNSNTPGDAVVTEVVQVSNVSATQLVPVLRPLMSTEAQLAAYPQSNVLIMSDRASNITRILEIIQRLDQATENDVEVITLQNAPASDVVQVLTSLLQADASGQNGAPLKLVPDERTNSILVSGDKGQRLHVRALVAQLDMPLESGNTQVVYLRYAKAKDVSDELKGYVTDLAKQSGGKAAPAPGGGSGANADVSVIPDDRTNALILTAPPKIIHATVQPSQITAIANSRFTSASCRSAQASEGLRPSCAGRAEVRRRKCGRLEANRGPVALFVGFRHRQRIGQHRERRSGVAQAALE